MICFTLQWLPESVGLKHGVEQFALTKRGEKAVQMKNTVEARMLQKKTYFSLSVKNLRNWKVNQIFILCSYVMFYIKVLRIYNTFLKHEKLNCCKEAFLASISSSTGKAF